MSTTSTLLLQGGKVGDFLARLRSMGVEDLQVGRILCQTPCKMNII